jgi:hypothetical protein
MTTSDGSGRRPTREARVGEYSRGSRIRDTPAGTWFPAVSPDDSAAGLLLVHPGVDLRVLLPTLKRLAELALPGVLPLNPDLTTQSGRNWITATAPPGPALSDVVDEGPHRLPGNAALVLRDVAQTLTDIHQAGLAHGRLATTSVVLAPGGHAVLTDWATNPGANQADDVAAWTQLARLLAEHWCAESPEAAAALARAVGAATAGGLRAGSEQLAELAGDGQRALLADAASIGPVPARRRGAARKKLATLAGPPPTAEPSAPFPTAEPPAPSPTAEPPVTSPSTANPTAANPTAASPGGQADAGSAPATTHAGAGPVVGEVTETATSNGSTPASRPPTSGSGPSTVPTAEPPAEPAGPGVEPGVPASRHPAGDQPLTPVPQPGSSPTSWRHPPPPAPRSPTEAPTQPVQRAHSRGIEEPDSRRASTRRPSWLPDPVDPGHLETVPVAQVAPRAGKPKAGAVKGGAVKGGAVKGGAVKGGAVKGGAVKSRESSPLQMALIGVLAVVLALASALLYLRIKGGDQSDSLRIQSVTLQASPRDGVCMLTATINTNGSPGMLAYRWSGELSGEPVLSVSVPDGEHHVTVGRSWSDAITTNPDPSVSIQILSPTPQASETRPAAACP